MRALLFILSLCVVSFPSEAQSQFEVHVSLDSVLLGNQVEVTFTLKGERGRKFSPPSFSGFEVIAGPHTSTMTQIVNGSVSRQQSYTYLLRPDEVGIYYIEPAVIYSDGTPLETQPVEILVVPNPDGIVQRPHKQEGQSPFGGADLFQFDDFFSPFPAPQPKRDPLSPGQEAQPDTLKKKRPTVRL